MSDYVFTEPNDPKTFSGSCQVCGAKIKVDLPLSIRNLTKIIDAFCAQHEHKELIDEVSSHG